jgi:hypothetical protein
MLRDSRVSYCVNDRDPPFSFVIIDGIVEIFLSYAEAYEKRKSARVDLLIWIIPEKDIAWQSRSKLRKTIAFLHSYNIDQDIDVAASDLTSQLLTCR